MGKRPRKRRRRQGGSARQLNPLGLPRPDLPPDLADMVRVFALFDDCGSVEAARALLRDQIQIEVAAMAAVVVDADAFDVIELMRLRKLSFAADPQAAAPGSSAP